MAICGSQKYDNVLVWSNKYSSPKKKKKKISKRNKKETKKQRK